MLEFIENYRQKKRRMKSMLVDENLVNYYIGLIISCCFRDLEDSKFYNTRTSERNCKPQNSVKW